MWIEGLADNVFDYANVNKMRSTIKNNDPVILLVHEPGLFDKIPEQIDLTLSAHSHGGKVRLPFIGSLILPKQAPKNYSQGYIRNKNKQMIVSRGICTSILPVRFNCAPEIVFIILS